jgi:ubiquinone/menaquinone biosynthesis C-methylase UbiE
MSIPNTFTEALRIFYNTVAELYGSGKTFALRHATSGSLVNAAGSSVKEGSWVLDLASGSGTVAFAVVEKVGPSGKILGVDLSEGLTEHAKSTASTLGVDSFVEFICQDVTHLELPPKYVESRLFDVCFCGSAIMLFPDPVAVIRKIATELLKPGGIFVANTHSSIPGTVFFDIMKMKGIKTAMDPGWAAKPDETLRKVFQDAGMVIQDIITDKLVEAAVKWDVGTPEARNKLWEDIIVKAPWVSFGMKDLIDEAKMEELKSDWEERIITFRQPDGCIHDHAKHHIVVAVVRD